MAETVYGKHGVYVSSPGEVIRGEGGRGTGPVVTLRNIEVLFDKCDCEEHINEPGGPSPVIPHLNQLVSMVKSGFYDLTWDEANEVWKATVK